MKRKRIILPALVILSITCSCVPKSEYQHAVSINRTDFKTTQSLIGSSVEFDSLLMRPNQLQIYDDTVLITSNMGTDKLFHLFNLKSGAKIGERVSSGQGPAEMIMPWFVQNSDAITVFDMGTMLVTKYAVNDFVVNSEPVPLCQTRLSAQVFGEIGLLGDDLIGSLYNPEYPFYLFDKEGKQTEGFGAYPVCDISYTDVEIIDAYRSIITTNGTDRIAVCHFWTDLIDIYNKNGVLENRIHGPEHFYAHFKEYTDGNIITTQPVKGTYRDAFYSPVSVGEDFFVLYNGKFLEEEGYDLLAKEIFVFGWDGSPKQIFSLDQGVSRIAVDKKNKKIYGISDDPEYHIVEFTYN